MAGTAPKQSIMSVDMPALFGALGTIVLFSGEDRDWAHHHKH